MTMMALILFFLEILQDFMEFNIAHHTLLWEVSVLKNSQKFWPETQNPLTIGSVMIVKLDMVKWNIFNFEVCFL